MGVKVDCEKCGKPMPVKQLVEVAVHSISSIETDKNDDISTDYEKCLDSKILCRQCYNKWWKQV
jgi:hypothetical protein